MAGRIYRLVIPVDDIERAEAFYAEVLGEPGERVWSNRHYFHCGDVVLACVQPPAGGGDFRPAVEPRIIYFAVEDLDEVLRRVRKAGPGHVDDVSEQAWGELSFYAEDPFGNKLCFVKESTVYTGGRWEK
jgi:predicted enzyme related to lactoylglutathione lyase